jgi:hypothetical protein
VVDGARSVIHIPLTLLTACLFYVIHFKKVTSEGIRRGERRSSSGKEDETKK